MYLLIEMSYKNKYRFSYFYSSLKLYEAFYKRVARLVGLLMYVSVEDTLLVHD